MAGYSRRGQPVNVSQLLQDLNRVPEPAPQPEEHLRSLDDELAMFTNTNFIDWDAGHNRSNGPQQPPPVAVEAETPSSTTTSPTEAVSSESMAGAEIPGFDFNLGGDFNGFDFHPYSTPNVSAFSDNLNLQPIQPSPTFPPNGAQQNAFGPQLHASGEKGKPDAAPVPSRRQLSFEEQSRFAAEEDKRRRNTAASARFRVKKKAREQALEKREKDLADKVSSLEGRIQSLETENKWLRELVMEKTGGSESIVKALLDKRSTGKPSSTSKDSSEGKSKEKADVNA
ncbi:Uu.00g064440.m01.CDS01 [Anthostomella pinea]|uniref:Uu.00g064440.m01.CDS01 n=1 Tax=Anthostomella pinea TaxID=933095 RepID=A0AAI8YMZ6_9PEZI|nr:Uu.00g064440.m01.CDS01 [Anthostomella pinea]